MSWGSSRSFRLTVNSLVFGLAQPLVRFAALNHCQLHVLCESCHLSQSTSSTVGFPFLSSCAHERRNRSGASLQCHLLPGTGFISMVHIAMRRHSVLPLDGGGKLSGAGNPWYCRCCLAYLPQRLFPWRTQPR